MIAFSLSMFKWPFIAILSLYTAICIQKHNSNFPPSTQPLAGRDGTFFVELILRPCGFSYGNLWPPLLNARQKPYPLSIVMIFIVLLVTLWLTFCFAASPVCPGKDGKEPNRALPKMYAYESFRAGVNIFQKAAILWRLVSGDGIALSSHEKTL